MIGEDVMTPSTETDQLRQQLLQAQRLSSVGSEHYPGFGDHDQRWQPCPRHLRSHLRRSHVHADEGVQHHRHTHGDSSWRVVHGAQFRWR